ncbi:hypothetical protein D9M70_633280 [compost metagenome]
MWMSGPEWGYLTVDGIHEYKGAAPLALWSDDSKYLAFVVLHIQDVPNRKGAEGFTYRVAILRLSDFQRRVCLGNHKLAKVGLESFHGGVLTLSVSGRPHQIRVESIEWESA